MEYEYLNYYINANNNLQNEFTTIKDEFATIKDEIQKKNKQIDKIDNAVFIAKNTLKNDIKHSIDRDNEISNMIKKINRFSERIRLENKV